LFVRPTKQINHCHREQHSNVFASRDFIRTSVTSRRRICKTSHAHPPATFASCWTIQCERALQRSFPSCRCNKLFDVQDEESAHDLSSGTFIPTKSDQASRARRHLFFILLFASSRVTLLSGRRCRRWYWYQHNLWGVIIRQCIFSTRRCEGPKCGLNSRVASFFTIRQLLVRVRNGITEKSDRQCSFGKPCIGVSVIIAYPPAVSLPKGFRTVQYCSPQPRWVVLRKPCQDTVVMVQQSSVRFDDFRRLNSGKRTLVIGGPNLNEMSPTSSTTTLSTGDCSSCVNPCGVPSQPHIPHMIPAMEEIRYLSFRWRSINSRELVCSQELCPHRVGHCESRSRNAGGQEERPPRPRTSTSFVQPQAPSVPTPPTAPDRTDCQSRNDASWWCHWGAAARRAVTSRAARRIRTHFNS
jgi:hypothetical protein